VLAPRLVIGTALLGVGQHAIGFLKLANELGTHLHLLDHAKVRVTHDGIGLRNNGRVGQRVQAEEGVVIDLAKAVLGAGFPDGREPNRAAAAGRLRPERSGSDAKRAVVFGALGRRGEHLIGASQVVDGNLGCFARLAFG
jgi:hypothetical protein